MRIGLNAIGFNPGAMGGVETYFLQLLKHLQLEKSGHTFCVVCKNTDVDRLELHNPNFSKQVFNIGKPSVLWLLRGCVFEALHWDIIKSYVTKLPLDVIHHPFNTVEPLGLKIPSVLTFADMQQEYYPEFFSFRERRIRKFTYRSSVHEAKRIIVHSSFTRESLVERYGISDNKIDIIPHACGKEYRPIIDRNELDAIKTRYGLPDIFIYYPAALWPHKNHLKLLDVLCLLSDKFGLKLSLVLSGMSVGRKLDFQNEISKRELQNSVHLLGYIPYKDIPGIYNLATLMIYPSLFEGFGIPLVEAMACG